MSVKRKLILGIVVLLITFAALFFLIKQFFFSSTNQATQGPFGQDQMVDMAPQEMGYAVFTAFMQDPVIVDAKVHLSTDTAYFFDPEKGKLESILVKEGQSVKKGATLFSYKNVSKDDQYALEDTKREMTKLYNQRDSLIEQLGHLTGAFYNYRGDQIAYYWDANGKQTYYVVDHIGQSSEPNGEGQTSDQSMEPNEGGAETIREQIRQLNTQIEDLEIKMLRLQENQNGKVLAKSDGIVMIDERGKESSSIPLVRIVSEKSSVVGSVTEYEFYALADQRQVTILIPAENRTVSGKIVDYDKVPAYSNSNNDSGQNQGEFFGSSTSQSSNFNFTVEPDEYIQPGFSAKVNITMPGYVIPAEAIIDENQAMYVFLYVNGKAVKTKIETMRQGLQNVVIQGLNEGDQVILMPYDLEDGQDVEVMDPMSFEEAMFEE